MRLLVAVGLLIGATAAVVAPSVEPVAAAGERPFFLLPFDGDEAWKATTYDTAQRLSNGQWVYAWSHVNYLDLTNVGGGSAGRPVRISAAGTLGGFQASEGKVVIDHGGGWSTVYQHMTGIPSDLGSRGVMPAGTIVGYVGATGSAGGVHLHYAQLADGQPQPAVFNVGSYSWGPGSTYGPFTTSNGKTLRLLNDRASTNNLTGAAGRRTSPLFDDARTSPAVVQRKNGETNVVVVGPDNRLDYYFNAQGSPDWKRLRIAN